MTFDEKVAQWARNLLSKRRPTMRCFVLTPRWGLEEGREEGRARALLDLLHARGLDPDPTTEARILGCRDPDQLTTWLIRVLTITRLDELFG